MRYLLVIFGNDEDWTQRSEEELVPILSEHESFTQDLRRTNAFVAAEALQPSSTVTTIRINGSDPILTDGPYIETKEQIAGFYLIEVENLDQALDWGKRLASFEQNAIEVWPVVNI